MISYVAAAARTYLGLTQESKILANRALLIPPALPGSLGDSAMISAVIAAQRLLGIRDTDLLYGKDWPLDEAPAAYVEGERFFYRGSLPQLFKIILSLADYSHVGLIGADIIDGQYNPPSVRGRLTILAEAARLGKKATLFGASYNKNPEKTTRKAMRDLPPSVSICARDPISKKRIEDALEREIRLVADLAFLLSPKPYHPVAVRALSWIDSRHAAGDRVIALNANYLHAEKHGGFAEALGRLIEIWFAANVSILLIPHDTRGTVTDQDILAKAAAPFQNEQMKARIHMLEPQSPGAVKAVLASTDFLVTGRMHAAILALGVGTPAFCFTYQDKFEGLYSFFELQDADLLCEPMAFLDNPVKVAEQVLSHLTQRDFIAQKIHKNLPAVTALAQENFI